MTDGYGGGGFEQMEFQQQGGFESSSSSSKNDGKKSRDRQTLLPITVKQALKATYEEDEFKIDNFETFSVKVSIF